MVKTWDSDSRGPGSIPGSSFLQFHNMINKNISYWRQIGSIHSHSMPNTECTFNCPQKDLSRFTVKIIAFFNFPCSVVQSKQYMDKVCDRIVIDYTTISFAIFYNLIWSIHLLRYRSHPQNQHLPFDCRSPQYHTHSFHHTRHCQFLYRDRFD